MNKQQLELWLFPPSPEYKEDKQEPLTNKKFIFMCLLGISTMVVCSIIQALK